MLNLTSLLLSAILLILAVCVSAAPPPPFSTPEGRAAVISPTGDGYKVTFQPSEWPNAYWSAGEGKSWDWRGNSTLSFKATNPGPDDIAFNVRVDDDPTADGTHHCLTASGSLAAGKSGTFFVDLDALDSKAVMGMNGGPPAAGREGMQALSGGGGVDPSHVTAFQIFLHQPAGPRTLTLTSLRLLPSGTAGDRYTGIVDAYGQFTRADWQGKLHSEADFAARRKAEAKSLAAAPTLPGRDEYGGWADGPKQPETGYFATTKRDGRWWLVTPSGRLFLSFGVDTIGAYGATIVQPREALFTSLPSANDPLAQFYGRDDHVLYGPYKSGKTFDFYRANLVRKYGLEYEAAWRDTTLARLKSWGFNTIGNWSDETLGALHRVPYVGTLGVGGDHARVSSGSDYWGKMHDPYDPQFAADCDSSFREKATRLKNDPWCVGWFVDNELSWSGGGVDKGRYGLAYGALSAPAGQPAKAAFLAQLEAKYGDVPKLNAAWGTTLKAWDDLHGPYAAGQTPTDAQKADMSAFVSAFAKQYFTVVRDTLKKYDPNHLYLGCRFAEGYNPDAVRAAADVCDVVSVNVYNTSLTENTLQNGFGFPADPTSLGKPCIIGEFHCGALDRGLFHPGLVSTPNQAVRAQTFTNYVRSVVDNPAFVGCHWFQYLDEPLTGRTLDGENYNIGFVTVTDTPYPEMVQAAQRVLGEAYERRGHGK